MDIGTGSRGYIGHLVDERNLGSQERVTRILDQLGGFQITPYERCLNEVQRSIHVFQIRTRSIGFTPEDDTIGMEKILYRLALAQELGVADHGVVGSRHHTTTRPFDDRGDPSVRTHGNRALGYDHREPLHVSRDLGRRLFDLAEIRASVTTGGSADC